MGTTEIAKRLKNRLCAPKRKKRMEFD
jgi:hypothetical protein